MTPGRADRTAGLAGFEGLRQVLLGQDALVRDHHVLGKAILPGAAFVDLAARAVTQSSALPIRLDRLRLMRPLAAEPGQAVLLEAAIQTRDDGVVGIQIRSRPAGADAPWSEHAVGQVVAPPAGGPAPPDFAARPAPSEQPLDPERFYDLFARAGLEYGPFYRSVRRAWLLGPDESLAELVLPDAARDAPVDFLLHPSLLDGALQASFGLLGARGLLESEEDGQPARSTLVPYRFDNLVAYGPLPEHAFSWVRSLDGPAQHPDRGRVRVTVADASGRVSLQLDLLSVRLAAPSETRADDPLTVPSPDLASGPSPLAPRPSPLAPRTLIEDLGTPMVVRRGPRGLQFAAGEPGAAAATVDQMVAYVPGLRPEQLGSPSFRQEHGVRYAYVVGEMANGIASERMVGAAARAGLLAFFGAAGLDLDRVDRAIRAIRETSGPAATFGLSLLHNVHDPARELAVVDLYLRHEVHRVNASAFTVPTPALAYYRARGVHQRPDGTIVVPNRLFAKVSREEVARRFMEPPSAALLEQLVRDGRLDEREARLAQHVPLADDVTAEADSGGHTDQQPLVALLPTLCTLRDQILADRGYERPIRVGAAGGLGTPTAVAAAFGLGADYVLTGSVNQACVEAGTSPLVREMLAQAGTGDVALGVAADAFEQGSQVQVLRHGTMFAARSRRLYEVYRRYGSIAEIPPEERHAIERSYFRASLDEIWRETEAYFGRVDPGQLESARQDEHHRLALVLRWYLGLSSAWAQQGLEERRADFQVWCGPAMGAFNTWARGSFLEEIDRRTVVEVAENLMHGAAATIRSHWLAVQGAPLPDGPYSYRPRPLTSPAPA